MQIGEALAVPVSNNQPDRGAWKHMWKRNGRRILLLLTLCLLSACQGKKGEEARLAGIEQMNSEDYDGALRSFGQALEYSKGRVGAFELDILKYRAEAEYQLADYEAAAHTYGILLQVDGPWAEYYLCRSIACAMSGQPSEAIEDYQAAAEIIREKADPDGGTLLMGVLETMSACFNNSPEHQTALAVLYQQALEDGYASGSLCNRMGLLRLEAGDYDAAIELFRQGMKSKDDLARRDLLFNQAVAYERKLNFTGALELFEQYVAEFGGNEAAEKEILFLKTR